MKKKIIAGLLVGLLISTGCGNKPAETKKDEVLEKTTTTKTQQKDIPTADADEGAAQFVLSVESGFDDGSFEVTASKSDRLVTLHLMDEGLQAAFNFAKLGEPTYIENTRNFLDGILELSQSLYSMAPGYGLIMTDTKGDPVYAAFNGVEISNKILD